MAALGRAWRTCATVAGMLLALTSGCAGRSKEAGAPKTQMQADAAVRTAIRQSPEGFIFFPSRKAEVVYELPRLNEIAQSMRQPAAACFVEEAVQRIRVAPESEEGFAQVPDGQAKLRLRIGPDGKVLRVEVLESGFENDVVPDCVSRVLARKRFPENQTGTNHFIDVVYWVSLGAQPSTQTHEDRVAREKIEAGIRAKKCLQGRVAEGRYDVVGLNLVARNGATVANRIEQQNLSAPVRQCLATAFRGVRLLADDSTFIRPIALSVAFGVGNDGEVKVDGEEWLRLVKLEERARRAQERADMIANGQGGETPSDPTLVDQGEPELAVPPSDEPEPEPEPEAPKADPGKGGLRLDIGPRNDH